MADQDGGESRRGFAGRWSRRKHAARAAPEQPREEPAAPEAPVPAEPDPAAELPSIDDLDAKSDYTPFLARTVPVELRRQALRKLWRSSPTLANLDGLNDYEDDYRSPGAGKVVRTVFEVGKTLARKVAAAGEDGQALQTPAKGGDADSDDSAGTPSGSG